MDRGSYDSGHQPLHPPQHHHQAAYNPAPNSPYAQVNPEYTESKFYQPRKAKGVSPWLKFGLPILVLIIAGAVVGGVLATRKKHSSGGGSAGGDAGGSSLDPASASAAVSAKEALGVFPMSTNSYELPIYPSTTNAAAYSMPTFNANSKAKWPADTFQPSTPSATTPRPDRPRLIAPLYKWQALPGLISQDAYLAEWNATIFDNATTWKAMPVVAYVQDGGLSGSGILDVSRQVKERIKAFAYVWRMTNDSSWGERVWDELIVAAANTSTAYGTPGDPWNTLHFLDVGEMTAAFAIAYDWMYDFWTADRRTALMYSILSNGITKGINAYSDSSIGWWTKGVNGNWNCVCNGGLTMGALAILGDDPTGQATQLLGLTVPNAQQNCAQGPSTDGTWSETANYWYFGTTGHAEMTSSLLTATGSDFGLLHSNTNFNKTGLFHMYVFGMTSLFNYGDHGPNKYSTTANSMIFYGDAYNNPVYTLYQRDRQDAAEPTAMFWYDPSVTGAFWNNLPLDHHFDDSGDNWASMRTSWTDVNGVYIAMKAGKAVGHQTHGDLDQGDFVLDAMGQRWAGELGSGNYLADGYFSSEAQDSQRWLYYRKRTEGQNTILIGRLNQNVQTQPTTNFGTTGEAQGSSTVYNAPGTSTAYFTTDMSSAYNESTSVKRGIRFINGRKQILLQDEITASAEVQWRMHTNATVSIDSTGTVATLTLGGQTLSVQLLNAPSGAVFTTQSPVRLSGDPALPTDAASQDQPNPDVTVLSIVLPAGQYNLQVLFNPQWAGMAASAFVTPPSVPLDNWSNTSHN